MATSYTLPNEGATIADLADGLAILADAMLETGRASKIRKASDIAAWIDSARSSIWWGWRTPIQMTGPLDLTDFDLVREIARGRL